MADEKKPLTNSDFFKLLGESFVGAVVRDEENAITAALGDTARKIANETGATEELARRVEGEQGAKIGAALKLTPEQRRELAAKLRLSLGTGNAPTSEEDPNVIDTTGEEL